MNSVSNSLHAWKFFRAGGLDQVLLESSDDLLALDQLDPKLWTALGCPVKGHELDEATLALIDTDNDGRIGVPDVIAATKWLAARLNHPADLLKGSGALRLCAINTKGPDGNLLVLSSLQILTSLGKEEMGFITVADVSDREKILAANPLNGDGIIPPEATSDPELQSVIRDIIACGGGVTRKSGVEGVTAETIDAFFANLTEFVAWRTRGSSPEIAIIGDGTDGACTAIRAVRSKVDDYFARTRIASFDPGAVGALNRNDGAYHGIAANDMTVSVAEMRSFPLGRIDAGKPLSLLDATNPAWANELTALLRRAVYPIFGPGKTTLTATEWSALVAVFSDYENWANSKAGAAVEKLGLARAKQILAGNDRAALAALVAQDKAREPEFKALDDVERLVRYHRDLRVLLNNFVNFSDFYSTARFAVFQAGTLFLDGRSTRLCIRVDSANPLGAMSQAYIAYCACSRADGSRMTIAACFTQGDSDYLFVGRNGVFYDRQGRLWYAVITSIVDNPISIRQAFWSPYKKLLRMIEEQVAKRAAAADAQASGKLAGAAGTVAAVDKPRPDAKPPGSRKFDLALLTGIGVALGSIGTFLATMFAKFIHIPSWQLPLIIVGLILVISLPSMLIAALKLRHRTLGPILEGNGWAINGRVKINIPFGAALTETATLPPGSKRSLDDPYMDWAAARRKRRLTLLLLATILAVAAIWTRWDRTRRGRYFWQPVRTSHPAATVQPAL
jgi:hypothetical protein